eukprot:202187_1
MLALLEEMTCVRATSFLLGGLLEGASLLGASELLLGGVLGGGVPGDGHGGGVDDAGAEVADVLDVAGGPVGGDLLAVALDDDVGEGDLLVRGVLVAVGDLLEDDVHDGVVLVAVPGALDGDLLGGVLAV